MTRFELPQGARSNRMEDEEDEPTTALRPPVVESGKTDRLNPPVEYEVLDMATFQGEGLKAKLNDMGKDGWVLIATEPAFIFRRVQKPEEEKKRPRVGFSY